MFDDEPCPAGAQAAKSLSKLPSGSRRRSAGRETNLLNRRRAHILFETAAA